MICLCCGKKLKEAEYETGWHKSCIRRFFGTDLFPELVIDHTLINELADRTTQNGFTIPGVQKKISLHLSREENVPRLTLIDYPLGYILKPPVEEYPYLPESEHLAMRLAEIAGIRTVLHALMKAESGYAYITKRVDRVSVGKQESGMLAMEDFCQLNGRLTVDKYKGSYEQCAKVIRKFSSRSGLDLTELYMRVVFSYVVGNSDMHLKNFSLMALDSTQQNYILSPAYDLLPVNLLLPEDTEEFALALNGKKRNITRKDFLRFAENCGIEQKTAVRLIRSICSRYAKYENAVRESFLPQDMQETFIKLMQERMALFTV